MPEFTVQMTVRDYECDLQARFVTAAVNATDKLCGEPQLDALLED